ncbi:hypothetical protein HN803_04355 [candidate division WWE3 bacterium]|jgi:hypothetical protein|nr:hypothetical protein [candidate division WWE3 bacterium]
MKAAEREEILNRMCERIAYAIEAIAVAKPLESHKDDGVKKKAKETCKEASKQIRDYLLEMVKCASDPDFVLKDVPEIADEEEFKFLQIK